MISAKLELSSSRSGDVQIVELEAVKLEAGTRSSVGVQSVELEA